MNIGRFLALVILFAGCQEDDKSIGDLSAPTNLILEYEIVGATGPDGEFPFGDGSGNVKLKAHADNAISYKFLFSDQSSQNSPGGEYTKQFTTEGTNTYTVTVIAYGKGGVASNITEEITVFSNFSDPVTFGLLTGDGSKTWYFAASKPGHLGVGPNDNNTAVNHLPTYYAAAPWEKAGSPDSACLYDNKLTFTNDNGVIRYNHDNGGSTFYNNDFTDAPADQCEPHDVSAPKVVTLAPANSLVAPEFSTGTAMNFSDDGFMGYFIAQSTYEILSITETEMVVRAVMGNNPALAWYHIFTTVPQVQGGGGEEPDYDTLAWADEFETPGAPDPNNWTMEIGNGVNGWGNNEQQYYRAENAIVEGGVLKITAKAQNFNGFNYTSARMHTEEKFEFTYGKVEIRAKLPTGSGTWPALWMLGSSYNEGTPWPGSGEIDIMEHVGNNQDVVQSALHYPGNSAGNAVVESTAVPNASSEFHIYECIWSPNTIRFLIDGTLYHTFVNDGTLPFNADFFLIFNVAMGGNLGGTIAPGFVESSMEVDYVRVYQED